MASLVARIVRSTARSCTQNRSLLAAHQRRIVAGPAARSIATTHSLNAERYYTEKHEWVTVEGKIGTVGVSDYAQDALGDVVYVQLPDVGSVIAKEDEVGALESVKAVSEIISPVSGKVVEKNETVENKPSLVNSSCYKEGWLFKVELTKPAEIEELMNEEAYNSFLKSASH